MVKRKPIPHKKQEQINKKAIIWIGISFGIIVIVMAVLLAIHG
jgi:hypothetical protein